MALPDPKQPEEADDFLAGKGLARRAVAAIAVRRQPQIHPIQPAADHGRATQTRKTYL